MNHCNQTIILLNRDCAFESPRSIRIVKWLRKIAKIHVLSFHGNRQKDCYGENTVVYTFFKIPLSKPMEKIKRIFFKLIAFFAPWFYRLIVFRKEDKTFFETLLSQKGDVIICQSLDLLPYAFFYKEKYKDAKIIFDAREFYPHQGYHSFLWRIVFKDFTEWLCKTYLSRCDHVITVSKEIQDLYAHVFQVRSIVIPSYPSYHDLLPQPVSFEQIRMIHHGSCSRQRHLERMIDLLSMLDQRFSLTFMVLSDDTDYLYFLKRYAKEKGVSDRLFFENPVLFEDIIPMLNAYDIGLYYLQKTKNKNHEYALPNKFFEYIQSRLMLVISDRPSMATYVKSYSLGLADDNLERLAISLNAMTVKDIQKYKENAHQAAVKLCDEHTKNYFCNLLKNV